MKAYSLDLRQRIINAHKNKENSLRQLASLFKVSLNFVQKLIRRYHNEGTRWLFWVFDENRIRRYKNLKYEG